MSLLVTLLRTLFSPFFRAEDAAVLCAEDAACLLALCTAFPTPFSPTENPELLIFQYLKSRGVYSRNGRFAADFDRRPDAESILEESRPIWLKVGAHGERGLAEVLCFLGMNAGNKGNLDRAESFYQEGLAVAQRCNHQRILAGTTLFQGIIEYQRGNFSRAMDLYQQSLEVAQRAGDLLLISLACENLGDLLVQQGSSEKARPLMERSLEINEQLQFRFGLAGTWINFAEYYRHTGNYVQAEHCIEKSMSLVT